MIYNNWYLLSILGKLRKIKTFSFNRADNKPVLNRPLIFVECINEYAYY